jgi:hypothetical protein
MGIDINLTTGKLGGENGALLATITGPDGEPLAISDGAMDTGYAIGVAGMRGPRLRHLRVGHRGGVALNRVSLPIFQDSGDGAAVNTQLWAQVATTHTATLANRITTLNAGNSVAINTGITHRSNARFVKNREGILRLSTHARFDWTASGTEMQIGFGVEVSATSALITDGIVIRVSPAGVVTLAMFQASAPIGEAPFTSIAGTTAPGGVAAAFAVPNGLSDSTYYEIDLFVSDDGATAVIADPTTEVMFEANVSFGAAQASLGALRGLPVIMRAVNTTATSAANRLMYVNVDVLMQDADAFIPLLDSIALCGRNLLHTPAGAPANLANWANSAAPSTGTLSNTSGAYTTLGGQFLINATLGAETDYALFAYTVPTGYRLVVKGARISVAVGASAAVATTPTLFQWGLGKASAVTLATNSFRQTVGMQSLPIGAVTGTSAPDIAHTLDAPIVVESGQVFHVLLKIPVGTATASQTFRGTVGIDGGLL